MNEFKKKIGKNPEHDPQWQQKRKWQIPWKLFPCKPIQQNRSLIKKKNSSFHQNSVKTHYVTTEREKKKEKSENAIVDPSISDQRQTKNKPKKMASARKKKTNNKNQRNPIGSKRTNSKQMNDEQR